MENEGYRTTFYIMPIMGIIVGAHRTDFGAAQLLALADIGEGDEVLTARKLHLHLPTLSKQPGCGPESSDEERKQPQKPAVQQAPTQSCMWRLAANDAKTAPSSWVPGKGQHSIVKLARM